ncbi:phosphatidylethanolamine-binding protein [Suillus paluster]|uniref:phosphatidylethanolamine-binding protein n=1 Tax=Suillus paluster TaxID=48578 RepID=UPI001B85CB43|nr:phosphatidylethanolamine-binding protein [Suillus paluster]KAG1730387.1 phosphatidylethanolamine-binding protein [Suillus paluster]
MLLDPLSAVRQDIEDKDLIPDVIPADPSFDPKDLLVVTFPTGQEALLGNTLTETDTADEPTVAFIPVQVPAVNGESTYTLVMTDPDAPSKADPRYAQFRHWVVTGVKVTPAAQLTTPAVTPYYPPTPPAGSGKHRYVVLLYQEPNAGFSIPADAPERDNESKNRMKWNAAKFAEQYGLKLVGVNYFYVGE